MRSYSRRLLRAAAVLTLIAHSRRVAFALLLCLGYGQNLLAAPAAAGQAEAALAAFVQGEYEGSIDLRLTQAVRLSTTKGRTVRQSMSVDDGGVIALEADPLLVVDSMTRGPLTIKGDRASAVVTVTVVAETRGEGIPGRTIHPTSRQFRAQPFELRRIDGVWRIANPGLPLVSLAAITHDYEQNDLAMQAVRANPGSSASQREIAGIIHDDWQKLTSIGRGALSDRP